MGEIVSTEAAYDAPSTPDVVEITGGTFAVKDGYFYLYFRDTLVSGAVNNLAVARAAVQDVIEAAIQGKAAQWEKYYDGTFAEPGLAGKSSYLENDNPGSRWMSVTYNTYLNAFIMVVAHQPSYPLCTNLYVSASEDGIHWPPRIRIEDEPGESFYPSILSIGQDPLLTGSSFYVYYTRSIVGEFNRWADAALVRRLIALPDDGAVPTPTATSTPTPIPGLSSVGLAILAVLLVAVVLWTNTRLKDFAGR